MVYSGMSPGGIVTLNKETDTYKQYYKLYQVLWRKIIECYEKNQWSDLMHIGQ